MEPLLVAVVAALVSLATTPSVARLARRLGAIDEPNPRGVHAQPTPRLGGLAVAAAMAAAILLAWAAGTPVVTQLAADPTRMAALASGALVALGAGMVDDVRGLSPGTKLLAQLIAAALAVAGGYGITGVTNPFTATYVPLDHIGAVLTLVWIVGITNAFNLIDGLDGLAAGVGVIAAATLSLVAWIEGRPETVPLWAALAGSLTGFLVYNFAPASIFLGDAGSLFVGYVIALLALQGLEKSATVVLLLVPVLALGVPIVDTALAVVRRTMRGGFARVAHADRAHLHHRLVDEGLSHRAAVLVLYAVAGACGLVAVVASVTQSVLNTVVVVAAALAAGGVVRRRSTRGPR